MMNELNHLKDMSDDIGAEFEKMVKASRQTFGIESTLKQILWDAQIDDEEFPGTMMALIQLMKACNREEVQEELNEIDLTQYETEEI